MSMSDLEVQSLWVSPQTELAVALATDNREAYGECLARQSDIREALRALKQAQEIRTLLARIDAAGL